MQRALGTGSIAGTFARQSAVEIEESAASTGV
jgi:hypothetical protein